MRYVRKIVGPEMSEQLNCVGSGGGIIWDGGKGVM